MAKAYIKITKPTREHDASLRKLGFKVEKQDGHFVVEHTGFVDSIDLTGDRASRVSNVKALVDGKKMLTYESDVYVERDGEQKRVFGIVACAALEKVAKGLSCLIAKEKMPGAKKGSEQASLDEFLSSDEEEETEDEEKAETESAESTPETLSARS